MNPPTQPAKTLLAGALCLVVLLGMMILHAWPLWTGQVIIVPVALSVQNDQFRGERLSVVPPGGRVVVGRPASTVPPKDAQVIPPLGEWWSDTPSDAAARRRALIERVLFLQLAPGPNSEYRAVTISAEPIDGMVNLRGRVRRVETDGTLVIDYGIDAYYMEEGRARRVEHALRSGANVRMQIAVARSGRARIKAVLINGEPS